jgi:hypothetical protein
MLDQERRRQHPHPVVHRADAPQLAHPGIDDGAWAISFQNTARPVSRASSAIIAAARPLRSTSDEPLGRFVDIMRGSFAGAEGPVSRPAPSLRAPRSNPFCASAKVDCFAALAMTR